MLIQAIDRSSFQVVPWRNGLGETTELYAEVTDGRQHFSYRLSIALVIVNGPFSDFNQYHRTLILLDGTGITLRYDNEATDHLTQRFDIAHFAGSARTDATLHAGGITDFNIMTHIDECCAEVRVICDAETQSLVVDADWLLLYAVDDAVRATSPERVVTDIAAGNLLKIIAPTLGEWSVAGGPVICVQISALT